MNLLITGGAGFIGSNLIRYLMDKPEISKLINLDCLTYAGHLENLAGIHEKHPRYIFEKVDLRDEAEVHRVVMQHDITHVIHLAAETHVDRSIRSPSDFVTTNINGTFHLLEACRAHWNLETNNSNYKFLHVSTDEVYGSIEEDECSFSESSPLKPSSPYSASKAAADCLVQSYVQTYQFPASVTRCSNNFGPRQFPEKLIPLVIKSVMSRSPIPLYGDGMNVRDWIYVLDHVEGLWLTLNRGRAGETYNIGGLNERTNLNLSELICDLLDKMTPNLGGHSRLLISFVADRPGHDRRYAIDSSKIRQELGWSPKHTFETGIRETIDWYLDKQSHQDLNPSECLQP